MSTDTPADVALPDRKRQALAARDLPMSTGTCGGNRLYRGHAFRAPAKTNVHGPRTDQPCPTTGGSGERPDWKMTATEYAEWRAKGGYIHA